MKSFRDFPAHVRARFGRSADYRATFGSPAGQRVLADLLKFCGIDGDCFVPGAPDQTGFELGKRRVALRVISFMNFDERAAAKLAATHQDGDRGEFDK
jgi:hypothetical protein